jgi:hypothetical protein
MTQSRWSLDVAPASSETCRAGSGESPLVALIRRELSEERLQRGLDLGGEHVPARLWDAALGAPLIELLGRPGKEFRSRLVGVA